MDWTYIKETRWNRWKDSFWLEYARPAFLNLFTLEEPLK
jgi:hypothetical protein